MSAVTPQRNGSVLCVVSFSAIGGFLFGLDQGNWAGAIVKDGFIRSFCGDMEECWHAEKLPRPYTNFLSYGSSLLQVGAALGSLLISPRIAAGCGRREAMFCGGLLTLAGVVPLTRTTLAPLFLAARVVMGVGVGMVTYALPMFIAEIAPAEIRGALGSSMQLMCTVGVLAANVLNTAPWFNYKLSFSLPGYPALILVTGIFCFPMSPRLALTKWQRRGDPEKGARLALDSLQRLRGSEDAAKAELKLLQQDLAEQAEEAPWGKLWAEPSIRRRVLVAVMLQWLQQVAGINVICSYGPSIFIEAGLPLSGLTSAAITTAFLVAFTIVAMYAIDRLGRRSLLLLSTAGSGVCIMGSGVLALLMLKVPEHRNAFGWALLGCVCSFMAFFAMGLGPVSWVYPSEIFPMDVKEKALALVLCSQWGANFLVAYVVPQQVEMLHIYGTFFLYGTCGMVAFVLVKAFVPETRGRRLEEMDELFGKHGSSSAAAKRVPAKQAISENGHHSNGPAGKGSRYTIVGKAVESDLAWNAT